MNEIKVSCVFLIYEIIIFGLTLNLEISTKFKKNS
jgi:hypothetical protein